MVALSSTEAEFIAAALAVKDVKWILSLLMETHVKVHTTVLYSDNQGAIRIMQNRQLNSNRTRHVEIKFQFLQQEILNNSFKRRYITGDDNVADIFTKPLGRLDFTRLANKLLS